MSRGAEPEPDHLDGVRAALLEAALPHAPFDGWTDRTLRLAERDSGTDPALARLALPNGAIDLVDFFWADIDRRMTEALAREAPAGQSVRQRIAAALLTRLALLAPHKEAARRAAALQALPIHAGSAARTLWHSVDAIWRAIGDTSTDFAFYTKRAMLAALWSSVLFTWFGDTTPDDAETRSVLDRGLVQILRIERSKARLRTVARGLPSPLGWLARLRYPEDTPPRRREWLGRTPATATVPPPAGAPEIPAADPWLAPHHDPDPWRLPRE